MFEHHFADVNQIRLHYVSSGQGNLILFAHGFPEFWYAWRHQLAEFGQDYQAVALDMRGYNLSAKPEAVEQYQIKYLVEDLRALVEHLGHETCTLVAHDWGGVVAWMFANRLPQYVDRLIIINAPHPTIFGRELAHNPQQQKASAYMLMFRSAEAESILSANNYARLVQGVLETGLQSGRLTEADRQAYLAAWAQSGALTGGLNYYRASKLGPPSNEQAASSPPEAELRAYKVHVPTLVIWGEQDHALLTGNLDGLDQFVPDLIIKRVPDGSHWVIHEHPDLINQTIRRFISGQSIE